jgi:dipeptidyl aminopeptidase/acylaminoacyl peptidase
MAGLLTPEDGLDDACAWSLKNTPVKVAAIVNHFGPSDLSAMLEGPHVRTQQPWLFEWLGPGPNRAALAKQMSPITYVRKGSPPTITVQGQKDSSVPYKHAVRLHEAMTAAGVPNELFLIPTGTHGQRNFTREDNIRSQEAIFKFLEKNGVLNSTR